MGKFNYHNKYLGKQLNDIALELCDSEWYTRGNTTKLGHPRHPLYVSYESEFSSFLIDKYIQEI